MAGRLTKAASRIWAPVRPSGTEVARAGASFLFGTALATGVVAAITIARSQAGMGVSVQVLDSCTVQSAARSATECEAQPEVKTPTPVRRHGTTVASDLKSAAAGGEEQTNDASTTFFF